MPNLQCFQKHPTPPLRAPILNLLPSSSRPYSQKEKDLARLADENIYGSDGNVDVVLALDIEYRLESNRASVSD